MENLSTSQKYSQKYYRNHREKIKTNSLIYYYEKKFMNNTKVYWRLGKNSNVIKDSIKKKLQIYENNEEIRPYNKLKIIKNIAFEVSISNDNLIVEI